MKAHPSVHDFEHSLPGDLGGLEAVFGPRHTMIVVETGQRWLAALRTAFRRAAGNRRSADWIHASSPGEVSTALKETPAACVVLHATRQTAARDVLYLGEWRDAYPSVCLLAAVDRTTPSLQAELVIVLREAGAAGVLLSPRQADQIVPLVERHWQRIPNPTRCSHGRHAAE